MPQVVDLLKEVTKKVKAHKDKKRNYIFVWALETMCQGADLKLQAFKKRDGKLLQQSEEKVRHSVNIIHGRLSY